MEQKLPFHDFAAVWKRVEASRPKLEGSAKLMPRKKPKGFLLRPFPVYGKDEATSSVSRD